jgi:hypothetical protein
MVENHPLTCTFLDTNWYHNAGIGILSRTDNIETKDRQGRRGGPSTLGQTIIDTACNFVELGFQTTTLDKVRQTKEAFEAQHRDFERRRCSVRRPEVGNFCDSISLNATFRYTLERHSNVTRAKCNKWVDFGSK